MNKISPWWLIAAVIIGALAFYLFLEYIYIPDKTISVSKRKNYNIVTLALPNSTEPDEFGPKYWQAFHKLAAMVPCGGCRDKAVPFIRFFHDVVNKETDKEIFDKENYNKHIDYICELEKI